jgi:hypothetical protein
MRRLIHLTPTEIEAIAAEFGDGKFPREDLSQCLSEIQNAYRQDCGRRKVTLTKHKEQLRALAACLRRLTGLLSTTDAADNLFASAVVTAELQRDGSSLDGDLPYEDSLGQFLALWDGPDIAAAYDKFMEERYSEAFDSFEEFQARVVLFEKEVRELLTDSAMLRRYRHEPPRRFLRKAWSVALSGSRSLSSGSGGANGSGSQKRARSCECCAISISA